MNEQLKAALNKFGTEMLENIQKGIDIGSQFLGEQLPLVAQEIINLGLGKAIFFTSMWTIITIFFVISANFFWRKADNYMVECGDTEWSSETFASYGAIFSIIIYMITAVVAITYAYNIVKIAVAPRVYLIEQLIQMTKGVAQ